MTFALLPYCLICTICGSHDHNVLPWAVAVWLVCEISPIFIRPKDYSSKRLGLQTHYYEPLFISPPSIRSRAPEIASKLEILLNSQDGGEIRPRVEIPYVYVVRTGE
jgi:hypothetical protein